MKSIFKSGQENIINKHHLNYNENTDLVISSGYTRITLNRIVLGTQLPDLPLGFMWLGKTVCKLPIFIDSLGLNIILPGVIISVSFFGTLGNNSLDRGQSKQNLLSTSNQNCLSCLFELGKCFHTNF